MAYVIEVNEDECIGCSACANTCPAGFKMAENKSVPVNKEVSEVTCQSEAADVCPVNCIKVAEK